MRTWIDERLKIIGKTKAELARHLGIPFARVSEMISGKRNIQAREIEPFAEFTNLPYECISGLFDNRFNEAVVYNLVHEGTRPTKSEEELTAEFIAGPVNQQYNLIPFPPNASVGEKVTTSITDGAKTIPVYGQAVAGVDGEFEFNGNKLFDVMAPPNLSGYNDAYAVSVAGDSMYPRYEDGEIAYVDPKRRVKKGDYVVAQVQLEENEPILAYIKKFVRHNSQELVLEQFNPPKEMVFSHDNVIAVHYIAMSGMG